MKTTPLGSLIALSALAVAPSVALAADPTTPSGSTATTPEPAPALTSPAPAADEPQALDPSIDEAQAGVNPRNTTPAESRRREERRKARDRQADRDPAPTDGTQATDVDLLGDSPLEIQAVPNFFIEDFDIPPFLLPLYQAAGSEYGVPWEVLASINRIETNFGRNLNISSAGARGWMQFMPATWDSYGVDANDDGEKDPFNPADAIFAAARYLKAAGAEKDLRKAIFAYNHADWYVDDVVEGARAVAAVPDSLVSSLTGLTQGVFPVDGADSKIDYAGKVKADNKGGKTDKADEAADPVEGKDGRTSIEISADAGSRVVAVQDGVVERVGQSERLGTYVRLRDQFGNRYTYAHLGEVQDKVPVPKPTKEDGEGGKHDEHSHGDSSHDEEQESGTTPDAAASSTEVPAPSTPDAAATTSAAPSATTTPEASTSPDAAQPTTPASRTRLPASPSETAEEDPEVNKAAAETPRRIRFRARAADSPAESEPTPAPATQRRVFANPDDAEAPAQVAPDAIVEPETYEPVTGDLAEYFSIDYGLKASQVNLKKLKAGQAVIAGTVLGKTKLSIDNAAKSTVTFEIRPAGKKAPRIDPRPILDGWRLSDKTDFYGAQAKKAVETGELTDDASVGQVLLMNKAELQRRVLADKRINIYECGRRDIAAGQIDRRILALVQVLAIRGVEPTITSLKCGHGFYTASGNVSHHTTGTGVDIATAYGKTITRATQGQGSVTDRAVREILKLQGNMRPDQIITLMKYEGQDNTFSMGDHDDHIHVGYRPITGKGGKQLEQLLKPGQWDDLVKQLSSIEAPNVASSPSQYSVTVEKKTR